MFKSRIERQKFFLKVVCVVFFIDRLWGLFGVCVCADFCRRWLKRGVGAGWVG